MALKPIQKEILNKMYYERRYMTIREIASLTGYSWQTVEAHLKVLFGKKFVKKKKYTTDSPTKQERIKYKFNYKHYKRLLKKKKGGMK